MPNTAQRRHVTNFISVTRVNGTRHSLDIAMS
jgi:hypothetical protein